MVPVIAIVGRPNVGKSTLFNRLTKSRDALVANVPGLTRDRHYGDAELDGQSVIVIDTGGIADAENELDKLVLAQSRHAIQEADIILFIVDGRAGMTSMDEAIAKELRRSAKQVLLVVNKVDGLDKDIAVADFYPLGFEKVLPIAAAHGHGMQKLAAHIAIDLLALPIKEETVPAATSGIKIAIVGRPNVGKSTLLNRFLGEERVVVYNHAGTTRDSIYVPFQRDNVQYTLIDTAGVRRRGKVREATEKFSIIKTLKAIEDSDVVICLIDANEGLVEQDLNLIGFTLNAGRALVIAINKWDGLSADQKAYVKASLSRRLNFVNFVRLHFISALHGSNVGHLFESINEAYRAANKKVTTHEVNKILQQATHDNAPPAVRGRRIKLRYAHLGAHQPPTLIIHGNQTENLPKNYKRYLENYFQRALALKGTPVKLQFRTTKNPYKKNK